MADSRNIEHISGVFHVRQQKNQFGIDSREEVNREDTNAERIRGNYGNSEERESTSYFVYGHKNLIPCFIDKLKILLLIISRMMMTTTMIAIAQCLKDHAHCWRKRETMKLRWVK